MWFYHQEHVCIGFDIYEIEHYQNLPEISKNGNASVNDFTTLKFGECWLSEDPEFITSGQCLAINQVSACKHAL